MARGDWQLGNWIRSSQQSCSTQSHSGVHVSDSPHHKHLQPVQTSKHSSLEVIDPPGESKPRLASHQKELCGNLPKLQQGGGSSQRAPKKPSADPNSCTSSRKCSGNTRPSEPLKAVCSDHTEDALGVKCVEATREKDPSFPARPKVKTKTGHCKKSKVSSDTKRNSKRTNHTSLDKLKAESELGNEVKVVEHAGHCPSCGVRYPNPCSCLTQSPAQPDRLSPAPPVAISRSKPMTEAVCQKSTKMPHKSSAHKHLEKTGRVAKGSRDLHRPPKSLLVKIDLCLLSRVPQTSGIHQAIPCSTERPALVLEKGGGCSDASAKHKHAKTSKKRIPQNVRGGLL